MDKRTQLLLDITKENIKRLDSGFWSNVVMMDEDVAKEFGIREGEYLVGMKAEIVPELFKKIGCRFKLYYCDVNVRNDDALKNFTSEQLLNELLRRSKNNENN